MPGVVQQAAAIAVLPWALCSAYSEQITWPILQDGPYLDGSMNRQVQAEQPTRRWTLSRRLTEDESAEWMDFYEWMDGVNAFFFYPREQDHDASGVSTTGRYKVVFVGPGSLTWGMPRNIASFVLEERR